MSTLVRRGKYTFSTNPVVLGEIPTLRTESRTTMGVVPPEHGVPGVDLEYLLKQETPSGGKKVISTCYFLSAKPMWNEKRPNYLLNLIKNIELYRKDRNRLPDGFLYRVYLDKLTYDSCTEKVTRKFWGSEFDYDIDEIVKETTTALPETVLPKTVLDDMRANLKNYKSLFKLLRRYIQHILDNKDDYSFLELITFECKSVMSLEVNGKNLPGHPETFGSIIRFFAFWDPDVTIAFSLNSSYVVNLESKKIIEQFISDPNYINYINIYRQPLFKGVYKYLASNRERFNEFLPNPKRDRFNGMDDYRSISVMAGFVGFKTQGNPIVEEIKILFELLLSNYKENDEAIFGYGMDEILLFQAISNILKKRIIEIPWKKDRETPLQLLRGDDDLEFVIEGLSKPYTYFSYMTDSNQESYVLAFLTGMAGGVHTSNIFKNPGNVTGFKFDDSDHLMLSSYEPDIHFKDIKPKFPYLSKFGYGLSYNESIRSNILKNYEGNIPGLMEPLQVMFCFDENKKLYLLAEDKIPKFYTRYFNLNSVTLDDILSYFDSQIIKTSEVEKQVQVYQICNTPFGHASEKIPIIRYGIEGKPDTSIELPFLFNSGEYDRYGEPLLYRLVNQSELRGGGRIKSKRRNKRGNNKRKLRKKYTKKRRQVKRS